MARIAWPGYLLDLMNELPVRDLELIEQKTSALERFPRMYPMYQTGRFRRHRRFQAGHWLVFYRVIDDTVYIRALWPARIP